MTLYTLGSILGFLSVLRIAGALLNAVRGLR